MAKKTKDTQSDMYMITINNPSYYNMSHHEIKSILINKFKTIIYFCMADEKGSTLHTHIFICFKSRVRFSTVQRQFPHANIVTVKGTVSENISYIKKNGKWENDKKHETKIEGTFEEWGEQPPDSRGKNHDMTELYHMVIDGLSNAEIIAKNQDYILQIDKIDKLRTIILTERYKELRRLDLKVIYIYGATGTGKTRGVLDEHGNSEVYRVTDYQHPFDSYACQPVIAFDEYRAGSGMGSNSGIRIGDMLEFTDIYPVELPARFSNKYACYNTVYIISNWSLEEQYRDIQKENPASWKAFLRRIHEVRYHSEDGKVYVFNSVEEYLNRDSDWKKLTEYEIKTLPFKE